MCQTTSTGGNCRSRQTNGKLFWIGDLPQHRGETTEQASSILGPWNWHCARTRSSSSGASCASIQPWGRNHDRGRDNTTAGGMATYNWLNTSLQTWGRASWPGSKRWHQALRGLHDREGGYNKDSSCDEMGGRLYTKNSIMLLKGYCGINSPVNIPTTWDAFQRTHEIVLY
jgi:hypothetical protein